MQITVSTNSRPKAAGQTYSTDITSEKFQHTAARRRLDKDLRVTPYPFWVSTHSRPKAAGWILPGSSLDPP